MKTVSKYNKQPDPLCFGALYKNEIMCIAVIIIPCLWLASPPTIQILRRTQSLNSVSVLTDKTYCEY